MQCTGTRLEGISFGTVGSLVMLQRGDVQVAFENLPSVAGAVRAGNLRALAVTSAYRTPQLPDVPTMVEAGVPHFSATSWIDVNAPPVMLPSLAARIEAELGHIAADPAARDRLRGAGFEPAFVAGAEFVAFQHREVARWTAVVRAAGLHLDL